MRDATPADGNIADFLHDTPEYEASLAYRTALGRTSRSMLPSPGRIDAFYVTCSHKVPVWIYVSFKDEADLNDADFREAIKRACTSLLNSANIPTNDVLITFECRALIEAKYEGSYFFRFR